MDNHGSRQLSNSTRISVVTNSEQLLHAYAVRSICFLEETGLPANFVFDGNDFQSTHIIVYAEEEPIGAARIRWFNDFAKIERTAFRKAHRNPRLLKLCADFIFDHAAQKGYSKALTLAKPQFAAVWIRLLGFRRMSSEATTLAADGEQYYELIKDIVAPSDAISIHTDPNVLLQIEGSWRFGGASA